MRTLKNLRFGAIAAATLLSLSLVYAQPSLVINDDFEVSYDGWTETDAPTEIKARSGSAYSGNRGMEITNRSKPQDGAISQKGFYLNGGETYKYSVFVKHSGKLSETFNLTLRWLYPDGKTYESKVIATAYVPPNKWTEVSASYATPHRTVNQTMFITTNSTADFSFDKFTVAQKGSSVNIMAKPIDDVGLKDIYARYFRVGSVLNGTTINDNGITAMILKEFNSISMENEMKPYATMDRDGSTNNNIRVNLRQAAPILNFCARNGIGVRGHVLVWHGQTPDWFFMSDFRDPPNKNDQGANLNWVTQNVMEQRLESYIKNLFALIAEQYPTVDLYAYDVVNEAVSDDNKLTGNGKDGARPPGFGLNEITPNGSPGGSPWVKIYGNNSFIESAFVHARKYAPKTCKLFYNDYNEYWDHKRDCIIRAILKPLWKKGLIDGFGMQSHMGSNKTGFGGSDERITALRMYSEIDPNFEVQMTELDISTDKGEYTLVQQAEQYARIFRAAVQYDRNVTAVILWGPNDNHTWIGSENQPLLFDGNNNRKPAWDSVAALIPEANWFGVSSGGGGTQSSSSAIVEECGEYDASFCGGSIAYADILSNSDAMPTEGKCMFIKDFEQIEPAENSTVSINGTERICTTGWEADSTGDCGPIEKPAPKNGGYYVYVKSGSINTYAPEGQDYPNGWQGIEAGAKPPCNSTPIVRPQQVFNTGTPRYYSLKGEPLGINKPERVGIYILKQDSSVKKVVVR